MGDADFTEGDHRPENSPEDYEETVNEIRRVSGDDWRANIRAALPKNDQPKNSTNVDADIFCEEYVSTNGTNLRFPHKLEIGVQVALNMLTLGSWLAVMIGTVLEAESRWQVEGQRCIVSSNVKPLKFMSNKVLELKQIRKL